MTNQANELHQGPARSRQVLTKSLVAAFLMTGTLSLTSAYALDLNANVGVGGLVDANVSLSLGGGSGLDADVDVDVGGGLNGGGSNGGGVNVAVGVGGTGVGVNVGVGTGGGTGSGGTGGGNGTGGGVNTTVVSVDPDDAPGIPGATRNSREGGGVAVRCVAGGDMANLIGTEVVDKQGVLLGWVEGATMDGRKLGKVWYKTTDSDCKSLQGGMSMAGDRVRVNALAAEIG
jgi:hypothetical protein